MKKLTSITLLTLITLFSACKKKQQPAPSGGGGTPQQDTSVVAFITQQNNKAAIKNTYINTVLQQPQDQPTTIHIAKAASLGDSLIVETRTVYLSSAVYPIYVWSNPGNAILGIDSVVFNKQTKTVRYTNDCVGCGFGGTDVKIVITAN